MHIHAKLQATLRRLTPIEGGRIFIPILAIAEGFCRTHPELEQIPRAVWHIDEDTSEVQVVGWTTISQKDLV